MAGRVKVMEVVVPSSTVSQIQALECPVTHRFGEVCQQYDPHSGQVAWCPFMYGLRIDQGAHRYGEARSPQTAAKWMAADEIGNPRTYTVLCLRQTSESTEVGAIRR